MSALIEWLDGIRAPDIAEIDAMLDRVSAADGVSSLSEHTYLHLLAGGGAGDRHALVKQDGRIVGYAFVSADDDPVAEFLVDPHARGHGLGARILADILAVGGPNVRIWAHGQLPAAEAIAAAAGMRPVRRLCRYTRGLAGPPQVPLPQGVTVRRFETEDASAWLALNAEVFVDLPDQGSWTPADLEQRLAQPWFDPAGFLLAFDDQGLVGFHWTKVHGGPSHPHGRTGEVYVLGVAGRARGTGLGSALTALGLQYLHGLGLPTVMLYVDLQNSGAVAMYERLGFSCADCDVQFALAPGAPQANATDASLSGNLGS